MSANVKSEVDGDNDDNEYSDIDCKDCDVSADSDDDVDEEVDSGNDVDSDDGNQYHN